jgi:hypothetical protein
MIEAKSLEQKIRNKAKTLCLLLPFCPIEDTIKNKCKTCKYDRAILELDDVLSVLAKTEPFDCKSFTKKLQDAIKLLNPIIEKMGVYSQDPLTHAEHVIENASERAKQVTAILEALLNDDSKTKSKRRESDP